MYCYHLEGFLMFYLFPKEDFGCVKLKTTLSGHKTEIFLLPPPSLVPCKLLRKLTSDAVRNTLQGKFISSPSYHETLLATTDPRSVATENHEK